MRVWVRRVFAREYKNLHFEISESLWVSGFKRIQVRYFRPMPHGRDININVFLTQDKVDLWTAAAFIGGGTVEFLQGSSPDVLRVLISRGVLSERLQYADDNFAD